MTTKWKFLDERYGQIRSHHGNQAWIVGEWVDHPDPLEPCVSGFHASPTPLEALDYVKGSIIAEVEVRGVQIDLGDKSVHSSMRILHAHRWTKEDSVALAVFAARLVLDLFEESCPGDGRPRAAVEAAEKWLDDHDSITAFQLRIAAQAANDAAWAVPARADNIVDAVEVAGYAASGARQAAENLNGAHVASQACGAVCCAVSSVDDDEKSAIKDQINNWIIDRARSLPDWSAA